MINTINHIKDIIEIIAICSPIITPIIIFIIKHIRKISNACILIEEMSAELKPNGGGSIFDRIKRIESEILLSKTRTSVLLSTYPDGIYECDIHGQYIWTNKALQDIFGLTLEQTLGNGWLLSVIDKQRVEVWDDWEDALKRDIPYQNTYIAQNKRTGKKFLCETCATPNKDAKGKILGYFGIVKIIKEITDG